MRRNDFILDMVESLGKSFGKLVFEVNEDAEPIVIENLSDKDMILIILKKLISDRKYNEAENILFQFAESSECDEIGEIGTWFYNELSAKSDNELMNNNFSRSEIAQGLKDFNVLINS